MGYCPFSQFESRHNFCIVTQGNTAGWSRRKGLGHDTANHAHDKAEQCCDTTERKARYSQQRARGLAGDECHDTKFCIVRGERERGLVVGGCVTIQSLYRDKREAWLAKRVTIQMIVS